MDEEGRERRNGEQRSAAEGGVWHRYDYVIGQLANSSGAVRRRGKEGKMICTENS